MSRLRSLQRTWDDLWHVVGKLLLQGFGRRLGLPPPEPLLPVVFVIAHAEEKHFFEIVLFARDSRICTIQVTYKVSTSPASLRGLVSLGRGVSILSPVPVLLIALAMVLPFAAAGQVGVEIRDLVQLASDLTHPGSPSFGYRPVVANVKAGGTVTFTNIGSGPHTVSSFHFRFPLPVGQGMVVDVPVADSFLHIPGGFDSSPSVPPFFPPEGVTYPDQLNPGNTFVVDSGSLGLAPGTHMIYCKFHPWMVGAVVIGSDGPSQVSVSVTDSGRITNMGLPFFAGSSSWGFLPRVSEVKQGTLVLFTNGGFLPHTVTSKAHGGVAEGADFNSGFSNDPMHFIFPGLTFSVDTSKLAPGDYAYHCDIHEWMTGVLRVDA